MKALQFLFIIFSFLLLTSLKINKKESFYEDRFVDLSELKNTYLKKTDDLILSLENLKKTEDFNSLKSGLSAIRLKYKRIEGFICYFSIDEAKFYINSAPLPRLEKNVPEINVIAPHGLQVLEELIYDKSPKKNINDEINVITKHLNSINEYHKKINLEPRHVFEISRQSLIRTFTLGVSGFDSPCSSNGIKESMEVLKSIQDVTNSYLTTFKNSNNSKQITESLDKAILFLESNLDFNSFNRYQYLKKYILPLYKMIFEFQREIGVETITEVSNFETAFNYNSESFFSKEFLNPIYFSNFEKSEFNQKSTELGKLLFFDPLLSNNNKRACASCHNPNMAFTDGHKKSIATNFDVNSKRNAPTVIDAIFSDRFFYDLRSEKIEKQLDHVIKGKDDFHTSYELIFEKLKKSTEYTDYFINAYPDHIEDPINYFTFSTSLGAYVSSLVSFDSPFDKSLLKESSDLESNEINGFNIFMGKGMCATCHFPPTFSGLVPPYYNENESEVIGVPYTIKAKEIDKDFGRASNGIPGEMSEIYKNSFKTVGLRNVAYTAPYMHNGVYNTLDEVMDFYNNGGGIGHGLDIPNQTLPFDSLNLNEDEIKDVIAFMQTLSDTIGLTSKPNKLPNISDSTLNYRIVGGEY